MAYEWDARKASENLEKHGISFEEAATVFDDPFALTASDEMHSWDEQRLFTIGRAVSGRLLTVAHTERGEAIRLISARPATRSEQRRYHEGDE